MNDDFDPRIADWLRGATPATIDDAVLRRIADATSTTPQRRSGRSILRAVGGATLAASLVAAVVVAVSVVAPRGGMPDVAAPTSSAPPGDATATASPSPVPSSGSAPATWSELDVPDPRPEDDQNEGIRDVAVGGPGFVAVGRSYCVCDLEPYDEIRQTAAIWTSVDGVEWEPVEGAAALGPAELRGIAAGPDGRLLAIGSDMRGLGPDEELPTGLGMWRSADGLNWERAPGPDGHFYFSDVAATATGWLVVGWGGAGGAMAFTSTDLETWTVEPLPEGDAAHGVAMANDGRILVVGTAPFAEDDPGQDQDFVQEPPRGWIGTPGDWEVVDIPARGPVASLDDRFVIVDLYASGAATWSSVDGRAWEPGEWPAGEGGGESGNIVSTIEVVAATSDGLVAGGTLQVATDEWVAAIWRSTDGRRWLPAERLPLDVAPQETAVQSIVEAPAGLVALGYAYYEWSEAAGWVFR